MNDKTSLQTLVSFLASQQRTVSPQTDRPVSVPSTVFGLVQYLVFQGLLFVFGFVSFFFPLPRQSVSLSNKNLEAKFSQYFFQPPDKNL